MISENEKLRQTFQENLFDEIAGIELQRAELGGELLILKECLRSFGQSPTATQSQSFFREWFYQVMSPPEINAYNLVHDVQAIWSSYDD